MGVIMPATWSAAHMSFKVCATPDGTLYDLYNEAGAEVDIAVAQQKSYSLNTSVAYIAPFRYVQVRSGVTALPVAQGGARVMGFWFER